MVKIEDEFIQAFLKGSSNLDDDGYNSFYAKSFSIIQNIEINKWDKLWSWTHTLFGFIGLYHRKAYIEGTITFIILLLTIITSYFLPIASVFILIYILLVGFINPVLIYCKFRREYKKAINFTENRNEQLDYLKKVGGTDKRTSKIVIPFKIIKQIGIVLLGIIISAILIWGFYFKGFESLSKL
ncbi:MAG TPA: hypothetical protein DDY71_16505 [Spirochaetia bacterium]|nr:MAG: hypothetical protein A2Y29_08920 [Spirochaetes bacterium GWE2_31_10]HBD94639.1 hypothetical protein [Spirochaetia bacterium]HBI39245.1 hypothetical protein [Spirochaetia bacterium]